MSFSRFCLGSCAFLMLTACEVQPSDPEGVPTMIVTEIKRGGASAIAFTSDRRQTPARTTCADGRLPDLADGRFDGPDVWNEYYVLEPGQIEAQFILAIRSRSGVSSWIVSVGPGFEVVEPPTDSRNIIDGNTIFAFDTGGRFVNPTLRSMTLRLAAGSDPRTTRATVSTILSTGGGRDLPRADRSWTLIAGC